MEFKWKISIAKLKSDGSLLLEKIDGTAKAGEIYVILGGQKSGKSALIKALSEKQTDVECLAEYWIDLKGVTKDEFAEAFCSINFDDLSKCEETVSEFLKAAVPIADSADQGEKSKKYVDTVVKMMDWEVESAKKVRGMSKDDQTCLSVICGVLSCQKAIHYDDAFSGIPNDLVSKLVKLLLRLAQAKDILVLVSISLNKEYNACFELIQTGALLYEGRLLYQGELSGLDQIYRSVDVALKMQFRHNSFYPVQTFFHVFSSFLDFEMNTFGLFIEGVKSAFLSLTTSAPKVCYVIENHTSTIMFDLNSPPKFHPLSYGLNMFYAELTVVGSGFDKENILAGSSEHEVVLKGSYMNEYGFISAHQIVRIPDYLRFFDMSWIDDDSKFVVYAKVSKDGIVPPELLKVMPAQD